MWTNIYALYDEPEVWISQRYFIIFQILHSDLKAVGSQLNVAFDHKETKDIGSEHKNTFMYH